MTKTLERLHDEAWLVVYFLDFLKSANDENVKLLGDLIYEHQNNILHLDHNPQSANARFRKALLSVIHDRERKQSAA